MKLRKTLLSVLLMLCLGSSMFALEKVDMQAYMKAKWSYLEDLNPESSSTNVLIGVDKQNKLHVLYYNWWGYDAVFVFDEVRQVTKAEAEAFVQKNDPSLYKGKNYNLFYNGNECLVKTPQGKYIKLQRKSSMSEYEMKKETKSLSVRNPKLDAL